MFGLEVLEGRNIAENIRQYSEVIKASYSKLNQICVAISALFWECAKLASKDSGPLQDLLLQLGLAEVFVLAFIKVIISTIIIEAVFKMFLRVLLHF